MLIPDINIRLYWKREMVNRARQEQHKNRSFQQETWKENVNAEEKVNQT